MMSMQTTPYTDTTAVFSHTETHQLQEAIWKMYKLIESGRTTTPEMKDRTNYTIVIQYVIDDRL